MTVTNTGAGLPGKALRHVRCVLEARGLNDTPVADASPATPHAFTPLMREGIDGILSDVFSECTASAESTPKQAPALLAEVALASPEPVTVVAAMAAFHPDAVAFQAQPVEVVLDGASAGRTRAAEGGQLTRVGVNANAQRFEDLLLESLIYVQRREEPQRPWR